MDGSAPGGGRAGWPSMRGRADVASGLYDSEEPVAAQQRAFRGGRIPVAVYGLGKLGLPIAAAFAEACGNVVGADVDPAVVESVNRGECHRVREPDLPALVERTVADGSLEAVADPRRAAQEAAIHVIVVPTLLTGGMEPDLSNIEAVGRAIAGGLDPGDAVFLESTVPPGTCRELLLPLLTAEGNVPLDAFGLACCPERTRSGDALANIRGTFPKVIGGVDRESERVATLVYGELTSSELVTVADASTAEAVKVFEGIYRDVNIALANELATYVDSIPVDVREAIAAANTLPLCQLHDPGPGVGGHCIPIYPYFLLASRDGPDRADELIPTARAVNDRMPGYVAEVMVRRLGEHGVEAADATVAILGLTYRPGVPETRNSPARGIARRLADLGVDVLGVDPLVADDEIEETFGVTPASIEACQQRDLDGMIINTYHETFESIDWAAFDGLVVLDGRDDLESDPDVDGTARHVYTIGRDAS